MAFVVHVRLVADEQPPAAGEKAGAQVVVLVAADAEALVESGEGFEGVLSHGQTKADEPADLGRLAAMLVTPLAGEGLELAHPPLAVRGLGHQLRTADEVGAGSCGGHRRIVGEGGEEPVQPVGRRQGVVVEEDHDTGAVAGRRSTLVATSRKALVLVVRDDGDPGKSAESGRGRVTGTVVDDDDLVAHTEGGPQGLQTGFGGLPFIPGGDDDGSNRSAHRTTHRQDRTESEALTSRRRVPRHRCAGRGAWPTGGRGSRCPTRWRRSMRPCAWRHGRWGVPRPRGHRGRVGSSFRP